MFEEQQKLVDLIFNVGEHVESFDLSSGRKVFDLKIERESEHRPGWYYCRDRYPRIGELPRKYLIHWASLRRPVAPHG